MSLYINYNLPPVLLRVFSERHHAEMFLRGELRLMERFFYRRAEDAERADDTEGEGELLVPGVAGVPVRFGIVRLQPIYTLCTCGTSVEMRHLTKKGAFVVRITDSRRLFEALLAAMATAQLPDGRRFTALDSGPVRYDKGEHAPSIPEDEERERFTYLQKPPRFSADCEYRIAVHVSGPLEHARRELFLNIGATAGFVEWDESSRAA